MTLRQRNFWLVVRDCLCTMHGMGSQDAGHLVQQFCDLISDYNESHVLYQQEPFWVACALKNADIDIREWLLYYILILKSRGL